MNKTYQKVYNPSEIEEKWTHEWEVRSLYSISHGGNTAGETFSIQLPPPNVTGTLHMGHAFNQTLMDILARWNRMLGKKTVWIPGTDHAGIATQLVVERNLEREGLTKEELGRETFVQKVWDWKKLSGDTITNQMRRLGSSCDWSSEYFTVCIVPLFSLVSATKTKSLNPLCILSRSTNVYFVGFVPGGYSVKSKPPESSNFSDKPLLAEG